MKKAFKPDAALKHLDNLIGTWDIVGRTMDSKVDNIKGHIKIEWILDGNFDITIEIGKRNGFEGNP